MIDTLVSDRAVVCGDLVIVDTTTGEEIAVTTDRIDVSHTAWRDADHVAFSGHRGRRTVIAELDMTTRQITELWDSEDTCGDAWSRRRGRCPAPTRAWCSCTRRTTTPRPSTCSAAAC